MWNYDLAVQRWCCGSNREFKIYDATVAKTSLKIASSSFSIYFAIMSVCLTFESQRNYAGTEFWGAVSTLEKNIQIWTWVFTFSVKLEKWSFHVTDLPRTWKKCTELKKAREGRAKLLFLSIKYANFVATGDVTFLWRRHCVYQALSRSWERENVHFSP